MTTNDDWRYRAEHPDHFGDNWPFVSEAHAPSRARAWAVDILIGVVCGGAIVLAGAAIARVGQMAGWWG
jgi:hypothetical protein